MIVARMAESQKTQRSADLCFDALYRRHHQEILAYCLRRLPADDAEDAAAEVFAVAWRRLDRVPDGDRAIAWLYATAHRVLANQWRSGRRRRRLAKRLLGLGTTSPETPEAQVVRLYEHEMLLAALDRLRWSDKEILRLATWEKLPHATIGEVLGIRDVAVGQRIFRARKRLAGELRRVEREHRNEAAVGKEGRTT